MKKRKKIGIGIVGVVSIFALILFPPFLERPKYKVVKVGSSVWVSVQDGTQRVSIYDEFIKDYLPRKPFEVPPQVLLP